MKFTFNITVEQETLLDVLKTSLGVVSRADVIRKALQFAELYAEIRTKKQTLLVADENGVPLERIRIL